jgi:hypothetical protein
VLEVEGAGPADADDEVVVEHWPGNENVIRMVRAGLSAVAHLLPGKWESRV